MKAGLSKAWINSYNLLIFVLGFQNTPPLFGICTTSQAQPKLSIKQSQNPNQSENPNQSQNPKYYYFTYIRVYFNNSFITGI